jgi:5-formyltetrahydrofolate cyclo-ligase
MGSKRSNSFYWRRRIRADFEGSGALHRRSMAAPTARRRVDEPAIAEAKQQMRASARAARRALEPELRRAASEAICRHLLALPRLADASVVLGYAAGAEEPDPSRALVALRDRGAAILLPRVTGDRLEVVAVEDLAALAPGYLGIPEPAGPAVAMFPPSDTAGLAVLVPGVAFDPQGGRLGQGGGHYDRQLALFDGAATAPLLVGVAFTTQLVHEVPRTPHDRGVHLVVTEDGAIGPR